ncbi:MAG TPA: (2Fe-2S)-binding protein [Caldisericia bacterium]|nr:(2Fe-2S)-binding protein [Caldisericia bacterium]
MEKINFKVNGVLKTVEIEGYESLLEILREKFNLTGTKRGCDDGSCGACTVIVNDEAVKSCIFSAKKVDNAEVITIEGLAKNGELHPIQKAMIDSGAVQCGYCTPGIIMELYSLFNKNLDVDEEQIIEALSKHLCRCTGYESILDGAKLAQRYLKEK